MVSKPTPGGPTDKLTGELGLAGHVRFVHGMGNEELAALLASAQIAVVPSLYEGFSLPAVEHMASGTPLVASRTGALPEVTGDAAVLVEPGVPGELAVALRRLLDHPQERERLGDAPAPGRRAVRLARGRPRHGGAVPRGDRDGEGSRALLTVDFGRLGVTAGTRVLDLGCGAGRHAFEALRRGAHVTALDSDAGELAQVSAMFAAMHEAGEVPSGATGVAVRGDATAMPFGKNVFDLVIAAEVLEHIPRDQQAMHEVARVLAPGGVAAVTVPAWLPERICWALSDDYHNVPGGHVRIYTRGELEAKLARAGLAAGARHHAHGLLLVAEVRGRGARRRPPAGPRLPPAARVGHRAAARRHPAGRAGAQPADRQEPRRVREKDRFTERRCRTSRPRERACRRVTAWPAGCGWRGLPRSRAC